MATYLLAYHGGGMPDSPEAQTTLMAAWGQWSERLGAALIDGGNPVAQARTIATDGSVGGAGGSSISGYSIIAADSLDAAVALAKDCPVLQSGATIEVCETFDAM
jgi:hypothetical protein